jgi:hypothetical protein
MSLIDYPSLLLFLGSMFVSRIERVHSSYLAVASVAAARSSVAAASSAVLGDVVRKVASRSISSSSASMMGTIRDVSATDFAEEVRTAPKDSFVVVDVREPWELELARLRSIPFVNVPMSKLGTADEADALRPVDPAKPVYLMVSGSSCIPKYCYLHVIH